MLSIVAFLLSTRHGIGILPDSTRYMNLVAQPWDAPLYAWLLAAVAASGLAIEEGAKLIGLVLVALNSFLVWHIVMRVTRRAGHALIGTALVLLSPQFVAQHSLAMSEAPFIATILLSLLALLKYWETERRGWLWASAAAIGLAALTRFTAPALAAAVIASLLIDPRRSFGRRLGDATIAGGVSGAMFFAWAGLSELILGRSTGRPLQLYGNMDAEAWLQSFKSLTAWVAPDDVPLAIRGAFFILTFIACAWLVIRYADRTLARARIAPVGEAMLPLTLGFFFVFYLLFMVLATSVEANLLLNSRYAFPIYLTSVMMMTIVLADARGWSRRLHAMLAVVALLVLAGHVVRTAYRVNEAYAYGIGYAALAWTQSPTLDAVRRLPPDALIYSNGPDAIAYVTKRRARAIPFHFQLRTGRDDPRRPFVRQLGEFGRDMAVENSFLVFLDGIDWRFYAAKEADLVRRFDLVLVNRERDGRIYAARHPAMN
jgi:4-amino-4-deoxy-L-arabinose transferase-like glycosyltransferase